MDPLSLPLALIEAAWNAVIRARPELQAAVTALDGRVVQITLKGLERSFFVLVSEGQLQLQGEWQGEPDAHISGTPLAFMALRAGEEATLFRGEVTIDGDAQLGREFRKLLDQIAEHWEAPLAGVVGEESAAKLKAAWEEFFDWSGQTLLTFARDFAGYMKSDAELLAEREAVANFLDAVDTLRSDVDRLAARVKRLQDRSAG
ncbi:MAG: hypothetical protein DWQ09_06860 [Proteobacteria bacterium]|nr:MAG: hypothetical protein DWQ09_06860 [Pseudomonadota bacterium]